MTARCTVIAQLAAADGAMYHRPVWPAVHGLSNVHHPGDWRPEQASDIPIDRQHTGHRLGQIVHLERARDGRLIAVGVLDDDPHEHGAFISPGTNFVGSLRFHRDVVLDHVAVVEGTASVGAPPYQLVHGDVRTGGHAVNKATAGLVPLLDRARRAVEQRRHGDQHGQE